MKVSKKIFVETFAKHVSKKISKTELAPAQLAIVSTALNSIFNQYWDKSGLIALDDKESIDINALEEKLNTFFKFIPMIQLPMEQFTISINKQDADAFIKDLKTIAVEDAIEVK